MARRKPSGEPQILLISGLSGSGKTHALRALEDIGWLCIRSWRFGNDELPVAGVGSLEEFVPA